MQIFVNCKRRLKSFVEFCVINLKKNQEVLNFIIVALFPTVLQRLLI